MELRDTLARFFLKGFEMMNDGEGDMGRAKGERKEKVMSSEEE